MITRMWRMLRDCFTHGHEGETLSCEDVRAHIFRLLDGDLDDAARRHVEGHLKMCRHCFSRLEYARMMRRLTKEQVTGVRAPAALARRIRRIGAA